MADPSWHRSARTGAVAGKSRARRRHPRIAGAPHLARPDGRLVQGDGDPLATLALPGRLCMNCRDARSADMPAIDRVFRQSFCETFGHLYRPEDLGAFLAKFTPEAWTEEFSDPRYRFRIAEIEGEPVGYLKLGPSTLPVETEDCAIELRQLYILKEYHGVGI